MDCCLDHINLLTRFQFHQIEKFHIITLLVKANYDCRFIYSFHCFFLLSFWKVGSAGNKTISASNLIDVEAEFGKKWNNGGKIAWFVKVYRSNKLFWNFLEKRWAPDFKWTKNKKVLTWYFCSFTDF